VHNWPNLETEHSTIETLALMFSIVSMISKESFSPVALSLLDFLSSLARFLSSSSIAPFRRSRRASSRSFWGMRLLTIDYQLTLELALGYDVSNLLSQSESELMQSLGRLDVVAMMTGCAM
jgi:hypothetical protein